MYLKITNKDELHYGLQYHDGLIIDPNPFQREGSCVPGGIYFTTPEFIRDFLDCGPWIREVTIPKDAEMVQDPEGDKWRASKVILSPRKSLTEVDTWKWLIECGVDITHADGEWTLIFAASHGCLELVKYLIEKGSDIHDGNDCAFRIAASFGHLDIAEYLIENGVNIHAKNDEALRFAAYHKKLIWSVECGRLEIVKYLVKAGADIHAQNDEALRLAIVHGYSEIIEFIKSCQ